MIDEITYSTAAKIKHKMRTFETKYAFRASKEQIGHTRAITQ